MHKPKDSLNSLHNMPNLKTFTRFFGIFRAASSSYFYRTLQEWHLFTDIV